MGRPIIDLTGQTFGYLFVLERAGIDKYGQANWLVRCIVKGCGKEIVVAAGRLKSKQYPITHCGCLTKKHLSDGHKELGVKNLIGQKFGDLIVIAKAGKDKNGKTAFLARCEVDNCGKIIEVTGSRLTTTVNPKTHCGCRTSQNCSNGNKIHGLSETLEYYRERNNRRRVKIEALTSTSSLSYLESINLSRSKLEYCVYCGVTDNLSTDHIIPIYYGGNNDIKNLVTACMSCNKSKRSSFFIDWYLKTNRVKRKLDDILKDMRFDSIVHLQNYQDSMCPEHIEQDPDVRFRKLVKATSKDMEFLESYYRSLL